MDLPILNGAEESAITRIRTSALMLTMFPFFPPLFSLPPPPAQVCPHRYKSLHTE